MHGVFIVEGPKIVLELVGSDFKISKIYGLQSWIEEHSPILENKGIGIFEINEEELGRISGMKNPASVLALVEIPGNNLNQELLNNDLCLALDNISDPGNFGTIIRTADWFNIRQIICSAESVEVFNPKVIQSSMGSISRVNIVYEDLKDLFSRLPENVPVYGAVMDGLDIYSEELGSKGIIIIGNEAHGISPSMQKYITRRISIPSFGKTAESLNAAVATSIICSEFRRRDR